MENVDEEDGILIDPPPTIENARFFLKKFGATICVRFLLPIYVPPPSPNSTPRFKILKSHTPSVSTIILVFLNRKISNPQPNSLNIIIRNKELSIFFTKFRTSKKNLNLRDLRCSPEKTEKLEQ
ncbi:hypothetical protein ACP275_04G131400 [Erythranthe tilingii]